MNLGLLGFMEGILRQRIRDEQKLQELHFREQQRQELLKKLFGTPGVENGISIHQQAPTVEEEIAKNVGLLGQGKGLLQQMAERYKLGGRVAGVLSPENFNLELNVDAPRGTPGLLSRQYLETGIPTIKDSLILQVYGFQRIPQTKLPEPPKVKSFKVLDTGDALIPLVVMDNGETIFPGQFYKKLSPKEKEYVRLKQKELGFKIRKLKDEEDWKAFQKWATKQRLDIARERSKILKERTDIERQRVQRETQEIPDLIKIEEEAYRLLNKRYKTIKDPITGELRIRDLLTGEEVSPEQYREALRKTIDRIVATRYPQFNLFDTWEYRELSQPMQRPSGAVDATKVIESLTGIKLR